VSSTLVSAWRVLENKIAVMTNLERREIAVESLLCSLCGVEEETCLKELMALIRGDGIFMKFFLNHVEKGVRKL